MDAESVDFMGVVADLVAHRAQLRSRRSVWARIPRPGTLAEVGGGAEGRTAA